MSPNAPKSISARPAFALVWSFCAIIGCSGFATVAVLLFPELGFAKNPTGEFHQEMFVFAGFVGFGLGLGQAIAFAWARMIRVWQLAVWILLTSIAVAGMIFPLWWVDAEIFFFVPWYAIVLMAPGLVALALGQGLILRSRIRLGRWLIATTLGGAVGAVCGLFAAAIFSQLLPFEAVWAGAVAAAMAVFQRKPLADLQVSR